MDTIGTVVGLMLLGTGRLWHLLNVQRWQLMSREWPLPRNRCRGLSLGRHVAGIRALGGQVGVKISAVIADAPPDADEGGASHSVPPLREFFSGPENPHFPVFWEEDASRPSILSTLALTLKEAW